MRSPPAAGASPFVGRTTLVTGGGNGIGQALALRLAKLGGKVAVADIDVEAALGVAEEIEQAGGRALAIRLDATQPDDWRQGVVSVESAFGPIDVLCSNAGVSGAMRPLMDLAPKALRWVMETNTISALHAIQAVVPGMLERRSGYVLFTGSTSGLSVLPGFGDYCASKHALLALAETLREEVQGQGVQVTLFCPASVRTDLAATTLKALPSQLAAAFDRTDPTAQATRAAAIAAAGGAITSEAAARLALEGLAAGEFLVFTHPGTQSRLARRAAAVERGFQHLRAVGGH